jgi:hypothetical protein
MRARLGSFAVLILVGQVPARADVTLTPTNPVIANPATLVSAKSEMAVADPAKLVGSASWNDLLSQVLTKQGFTEENDWVYSSNNPMPPFPAGVVQPTPLGNNANFGVMNYALKSYVDNTLFGEIMQFRLKFGTTAPPAPGDGYTVTSHWLQIINEDSRYNDFGYALNGQPGFWFLDNGREAWSPGAGPFYDSNAAPGFSVPPTFFDEVKYYSGAGTYLHFTTIPAWDVSNGGTVDWLVVGNTGLSWGFSIVSVPEPSAIVFVAEALVGALAVVTWRRRRRAMA